MEWVKVSDKLPEPHKNVLVFDNDEGMTVAYYSQFVYFNLSVQGCFASGGQLYNVTHWMELPEPPKDKE